MALHPRTRRLLVAAVAAAAAAAWPLTARWRAPAPDAFGPAGPPDRRIAVVLAQLPLMLEPGARRALLLGWGDGDAAGTMLSHPLRSLDVVAAKGEDAEGREAPPDAGHPLEDSRLSLRTEDFETALAGKGPPYDVIVCAGRCSEAAVHLASQRLSPSGLAAFRAVAPDVESLQSALQRALRHFPCVSVWRVLDGDVVLLCSRRPPREVARLDELFGRAAPAGWLRPLGLSYPATLLSLQSAGEGTARQIAWRSAGPRPWPTLDDRATADGRASLLLSLYLKRRRRPLRPREYLEILLHPRGRQEMPVFRGLLEEWVQRYPADPRALAFLCVVEEREGHLEAASKLRRRLAALHGREGGRAPRGRIVIPASSAQLRSEDGPQKPKRRRQAQQPQRRRVAEGEPRPPVAVAGGLARQPEPKSQ